MNICFAAFADESEFDLHKYHIKHVIFKSRSPKQTDPEDQNRAKLFMQKQLLAWIKFDGYD